MILKEWVSGEKMTAKQFAKKIGTSRSQVHKYMHEGAIPRYEIMLRIFEVTKKAVTPNDFFGITLEITAINAQEQNLRFEDYSHDEV